MTPTERAIERVGELRGKAVIAKHFWTTNPEEYQEYVHYVKRCDKALARMRRGTNKRVTTA